MGAVGEQQMFGEIADSESGRPGSMTWDLSSFGSEDCGEVME